MTDNNAADANAVSYSQMRVPALQELAQSLGIKTARLRKQDLIAAIKQVTEQEAPLPPSQAGQQREEPSGDVADTRNEAVRIGTKERESGRRSRSRRVVTDRVDTTEISGEERTDQSAAEVSHEARDESTERGSRRERNNGRRAGRGGADRAREDRATEESREASEDTSAPLTLDDLVLPPARNEGADNGSGSDAKRRRRDDERHSDGEQEEGGRRGRSRRGRSQKNDDGEVNGQQGDRPNDDDEREGRGRGRGRGRDRKRGRNSGDDFENELAPDDVLLPIAGILDVLDNYAFVRTSGYLPGPNDVYVSLAQVKKYGLRKGEAIVGAIRAPREGEQANNRQKYNALAKIDSVNGTSVDELGERPEFDTLVPLYPTERLRLETDESRPTQRMIDLFAPIGKGTRGLIVAPPKSGKSVVLEQIAASIAQNSPETHLMVVLVDERPEEVTRLTRTIHGEVVATTFDMPAEDQTTIAELAVERAKRLVELGHDVVILLDSITQLARAYNLTASATGRVLAGNVDASALYPPKRFFGAARNIENGGSLTILATAMTETGSRTDEVILEEFAGTANLELRLSREIADRRIFPALDIQHSSALHEESLLDQAEVDVTWSIRRALSGGDPRQALERVLERLAETSTNAEFIASCRRSPIRASEQR